LFGLQWQNFHTRFSENHVVEINILRIFVYRDEFALVHPIQQYRGVEVWLHFFTLVVDEVYWRLYDPADLSPFQLNERLGGSPEPV
jgi:hypothetical protein